MPNRNRPYARIVWYLLGAFIIPFGFMNVLLSQIPDSYNHRNDSLMLYFLLVPSIIGAILIFIALDICLKMLFEKSDERRFRGLTMLALALSALFFALNTLLVTHSVSITGTFAMLLWSLFVVVLEAWLGSNKQESEKAKRKNSL